jgi:AraC family transcriptional regulator
MSLAQKAAWIIERNSDNNLTLEGMSEACGVSRSHLARAFAAATGQPLVTFLRARRLTLAAEALAAGAPNILKIALDAGYSSHEAFTRAFRDKFGSTPESVRARGATAGLSLARAIDFRPTTSPLAPPRLVDQDTIRVVGLKDRVTLDDVMRIPAIWQRFVPYMQTIPHIVRGMPVGIGGAPGEDGAWEYVAALEVTRFGAFPSELTALELPPARWAVFEHPGHVSSLPQTYLAIWDSALTANALVADDAPTLERHKPEFDPSTGEGGVEIWVQLRR